MSNVQTRNTDRDEKAVWYTLKEGPNQGAIRPAFIAGHISGDDITERDPQGQKKYKLIVLLFAETDQLDSAGKHTIDSNRWAMVANVEARHNENGGNGVWYYRKIVLADARTGK